MFNGSYHNFLFVDIPNIVWDASLFTEGEKLTVKVTLLKAPCGTLFTGDLCIGTRGTDMVREFVSRFYQVVLGRPADTAGLDFWANSLKNGTKTGADVARGFILSQEFINQQLDKASYVNVLYSAFFNRNADPGGYSYWLGLLNAGIGREAVLNGFISSQEFFNLCESYSIIPVTCTYSISSSSGSFTSSGGTSSVSVTASSSSCSWTASESLSWVSLSPPASGTGSGTVTITATANTGNARSGLVTIAGKTYTVSQAALCTYSISPSSGSFGPSGGTSLISVTATTSSCTWTASESLSWVSLSSNSGTGNGAISVTVDANTGAARTGSITIAGKAYTISQLPSGTCGAYIAPGVWKEFDCYNLAAIGKTTGDDPFTPSWRLIGGYWQWGRKGPDSSQWYNTNTANFAHGPTGPGAGEANSGSISGWDQTYAPNGSWSDAYKTANDPCPAGYRVPTRAQWDGVRNNNTQRAVGTWSTTSNNNTNYTAARFFGNTLMLPAAGRRNYNDGSLYDRGSAGLYFLSAEVTSTYSIWNLYLDGGHAGTYGTTTPACYGFSVRCVAE